MALIKDPLPANSRGHVVKIASHLIVKALQVLGERQAMTIKVGETLFGLQFEVVGGFDPNNRNSFAAMVAEKKPKGYRPVFALFADNTNPCCLQHGYFPLILPENRYSLSEMAQHVYDEAETLLAATMCGVPSYDNS